MLKSLILSGSLLLAALFTNAQNTGIVKGRVVDSLTNKPVEFATVVVSDARDTTANFISYTLTDKNGTFALHKLPYAVPLKLLISFVAYQPYRKRFVLEKEKPLDVGQVYLNPKELKEVTVMGERTPVSIRKDTIEFNAEAFKTRPNAVVEDLLKKLPGVEVDNSGKITVLGKDVTKVLIDGKEFFASDARVATKNLDADMIAKVQVYDDRENDPDHVVPDIDVKKIINLKFKKPLKKSVFGKVFAGRGNHDFYQASGLVNTFRDTLQVSFLGLSNNLNSTGFESSDLYNLGGTNRGGDAISRGANNFSIPNGKQVTTLGGTNINTDYGKKLKINLSYLYNHLRNDFNNETQRQQFLGDTIAYSNSTNRRINTTNSHSIGGTVNWKPNDKTSIRYVPNVYFRQNLSDADNKGNSYSNFVNPINKSVNTGYSNGNNSQFQHTFGFNRQLARKGSSFNIDHNLSINPSGSYNLNDQMLTSYVATLPSFTYQRRGNNNNNSWNGNISASFRYQFTKKFNADIAANTEYVRNTDFTAIYDFNPATGQYDVFVPLQSSDLSRSRFNNTLNPGATYTFKENMNLVAHFLLQQQQVNNKFGRNAADIDQTFYNVLPNVRLTLKNLSLGYARSMSLPNIGDMIPYSVVYSPLYSVTGNPNLKPTMRNNFSASYSKYNYSSGGYFYISGNYTYEENSIFRQRTINADLSETSRPINRDGRYNYFISGSLSRRYKKSRDLQLSLSTNAYVIYSHDFYVLNRQEGYQNGLSLNLAERVSFNWKDIIQFDPEYAFSYRQNRFTGVNTQNQNFITHTANAKLNIAWPKHTNVESTYMYRYNPLVAPGFQKSTNLLNVAIARQFMKKDRAELKLSCYDLLNQNISISRYVNENSVTDNQTQTINRYFMLTLLYKFNKSVTK